MFSFLVEVIWFVLPAWVANSVAIDVSGLPILKNYSTPIDFGKSIGGKRILGDGKTWRGLIFGVLGGVVTATLQNQYPQSGMFPMTPILGFMLGLGALVGDLVESFIKRRMGLNRGHPLFLLDHLDYIFGAFFFAWIIVPVNLKYLIGACFITVPVHFFSNILAWLIKLKDKPW